MSHTKGPWEWWTSNSMKRLSANDKDGGVIYPYVCHDGVADIAIREEDMRLIASAPDMAEYIRRKADEGDHEAKALWRTINGC